MTSNYNPFVHRLANFTVWWTVLLFVAGALVTSNDAALSVPDWPKSFGTWFPTLRQLAGGAFFEHSHRVIAGVLGVLILALAVVIWVKDERRWLRWFGAVAVAGVVVQAVLGGEVVRQLVTLLAAGDACLFRADYFCGGAGDRGIHQQMVDDGAAATRG